jgi:predicted ATPase
MNVQILKNDLPAALGEGLAALRAFGIDLPPYPDDSALTAEIERTMAMIGDRPIASLVDLPALADPEIAALQDLLQEMFSPTYQLVPIPKLGKALICRSQEGSGRGRACPGAAWPSLVVAEYRRRRSVG